MRLLLAAALACLPATALAGNCVEDHEDCVENCRIEHGMDDGPTPMTKCVDRCDRVKGDCIDRVDVEREAQHRSRTGKATPPPKAEVYDQDSIVDEPPPATGGETWNAKPKRAPEREEEEDAPKAEPRKKRRETHAPALVRVEGPRETVAAIGDVYGLDLVMGSGKQLDGGRMAISALASDDAVAEVKKRGCTVTTVMTGAEVEKSWEGKSASPVEAPPRPKPRASDE